MPESRPEIRSPHTATVLAAIRQIVDDRTGSDALEALEADHGPRVVERLREVTTAAYDAVFQLAVTCCSMDGDLTSEYAAAIALTAGARQWQAHDPQIPAERRPAPVSLA